MICPLVLVLAFTSIAISFPSYRSLAGLSEAELAVIILTLEIHEVQPPPGPLAFNGTKLVNNSEHPFQPLWPGDIHGPCPGLNMLASHGVCLEHFSISEQSFPSSIFCIMVSLLWLRLLMPCRKVGFFLHIDVCQHHDHSFDLFRIQYGKWYHCVCYIQRILSWQKSAH